jgi:hypothetical protein
VDTTYIKRVSEDTFTNSWLYNIIVYYCREAISILDGVRKYYYNNNYIRCLPMKDARVLAWCRLFRITLVGVSAPHRRTCISKTNNNRWWLIDFTVILPWACWNLKSGRRENSRIKNKIKNYATDDDVDSHGHCVRRYAV